MTSTHKQFVIWGTLFASSIIYNFYLLKMPVNTYDEGIILAGAERVLKGQLPHLDFWSMYPFGQYFTLAFLFKLFGTSILTERLYDISIRSLLSPLIYVITKKLGLPNAIAISGWIIALIFLGDFGFPAYPVYLAILIILFGAYFFTHHIETNKISCLIITGFCITVSAFFRHDLAGISAISILLTLLFRHAVEQKNNLRPLLAFIVTILLTGIPVFIYLVNAIGLPLLVDQLLLTPAQIMPRYRSLPYPTSLSYNSVQFYVYPFILIVGFFASTLIIALLKIRNSLSYGVFCLSLVGILFLNQVRFRSDSIHLLPSVLLCAVIGPILLYFVFKFANNCSNRRTSRVSSYLLLVIFIAPLFKPIYRKINTINSDYFTLPKHSIRSGYAVVGNNLQELLLYIRKHVGKNDPIYVGVVNHDFFVINDVIIYFLADRFYATKYHELHPGVTNTISVQNELIHDIESASVRVIVLAERDWVEPNESRVDTQIDYLDNYIREKFYFTKKFGLYQVWTRK